MGEVSCFILMQAQQHPRVSASSLEGRFTLTRPRQLLFLALGMLATFEPVHSQETVPIPIEEVLAARQFPTWTQIQISPDNRWVAYTLQDNRRRIAALTDAQGGIVSRTSSGVPGFVVGSDIWLANVKTGAAINLTEGKQSSWGPAWS